MIPPPAGPPARPPARLPARPPLARPPARPASIESAARIAGVYEAPGMELLGRALEFVYQAVLDRRATKLFGQLSDLVADQIYDGRWFDPTTRAAMAGIRELTKTASGRVTVGAYKGSIFFIKLVDVKSSLYNEADSSMEASDGLNPVSSQGYAEIQAVEARTLALAGQIETQSTQRQAKRARQA